MSASVFGRIIGLLLLLILGASRAWATHIVGGELDMQHRSGDQYTLTLNLYFDDVNGNQGALDQQMQASIFAKSSNTRMTDLVLPLVSNTFVNYTDPACAVGTLRTRKLIYRTDISLSAATYTSPQGYYVAIERCCRNNSISNIIAPDQAGQAFYLEFPAVVRNGQPFIDSTPQIFPPLSDYACRDELFYYDFGGTDEDGDSLVYDMVTPLNGHSSAAGSNTAPIASPAPYSLVNWRAGLGTANQIPGSPALGIDRQTGRLTVRPSSIGLFVFGVRCSEYRAGVKIGETRRDFQLYVLNCPQNATPSMVVSAGGAGGPYRPGLDTLRLRLGGNRCLTIKTTDPDPSTRLTVSTRAVNFTGLTTTFTTSSSGSIRTPGLPDTLTTTLCFPDCANTNGQVYLLDVIVADNGCSLPKRDTVRVAFTADAGANLAPVLSSTFGAPTDTLVVRVNAGTTFAGSLTGTDADGNALVLTTGQSFSLAEAGMSFTAQNGTGQASGSFRWQPTCQTLRQGLLVNFQLTENGVCQPKPQTQVVRFEVILPPNAPPVLSSTFAPRPPAATDTLLVRVRVNDVYTASLLGTDADPDPLTLTAASDFDLTAAGMEFAARNGTSQADGNFRWRPTCQTLRRDEGLLVRFQLAENGVCQPLPQSQLVRFVAVAPQDTVAFRPPNVITPNADGLNDYFTLPTLPADLCESRFAGVQIFSRWGQKVYQSGERSFRWSGAGAAGTYFYLITYTDGRRVKGWLDVLP
jgi:gliding motility-associated-like protein